MVDDNRRGFRRPRLPRWFTLLVTLCMVVNAAVLVVAVQRLVGRSDAAANTEPAAGAQADSMRSARQQAVAQILDRQAAAVLRHDRAGYLAVVDPMDAALRARQAAAFDAMAAIPFGTFAYQLSDTDGFGLSDARTRQLGPDAFGDEVDLRYRISGYDTTPVVAKRYLTFAWHDGAWYLAGDQDGAAAGKKTPPQLWDLGRVSVVRGARSLVLGLGDADRLRAYADEADLAVPTVNRVWGTAWGGRVVLYVPNSESQLAALLDAKADDYRQIAAVTTGELGAPADAAPADRVIINPDAFGQLRPVGRRVVMTHELTHVATRAFTRDWTPTWLSEGAADYTGYVDAGVPVPMASVELRRDVLAGRVPSALPDSAAFGTTNGDLAQAYEMSWLACKMLADSYGQDKLVAFYRAVGAAQVHNTDSAVSTAMTQVLGQTVPAFTARWRAYLKDVEQ